MSDGSDIVGALCGPFICVGPFGLFFLLFFGIIAAGVFLSYRQGAQRNEAMGSFASENGLQLTPGGWFSMPSLRGNYKGHPMEMGYFQRSEGGGRSRHTHTYFYVRLMTNTAPQFSLSVSREGLMSWLGKGVGLTHEITIDVPEFDQKYLISTNDALRAKRVLSPEVRTGIDQAISMLGYSSVSIDAGAMYLQKETSWVSMEMMRAVAEALSGIATAVDSY